MPNETPPLRRALVAARKARRLSQLQLALRLGVSQRHVSFVESGRAAPSRELLAGWLHELEAPLVVRNEAMLQAGYAPVYSSAPLHDPALARAREALDRLVQAHDPLPALLLDAEWNVRGGNRGGHWLASLLVPSALLAAAAPLNLLDAFVHPDGIVTRVRNLAEVGPALLAHVRHEALGVPALEARAEALARVLRERLGEKGLRGRVGTAPAPVLAATYTTAAGDLSFFSLFTTFGTPQDITLASLRVEHLIPADASTHQAVVASVG